MNYKINYCNALCDKYDSAVMARIAIRRAREIRATIVQHEDDLPDHAAYIIRQLKRPSEVRILRGIYGRQFILISAYGSAHDRKIKIEEKIKRSVSTLLPQSEISHRVNLLVERDEAEGDNDAGQQIRDTFHLGDVFLDGIHRAEMKAKLNRFIQAFFGRNDISPSKQEYGMYAAKSASLRSADLSRQVGAAIFSDDGELITQGCNEVPKAGGGTYWDLEEPDHRDIKLGVDPNEEARTQLLRDIFERLVERNLIPTLKDKYGNAAAIVDALVARDPAAKENGPLVDSKVMALTEFGRVVHAEMLAICDAARLGKSVKGGTLYCTTFPCHNCAKHIIAAGIKKVVYMEPYPKSRAAELHKNEIAIERYDITRVSFIPFLGISPFRYRDIFQKGSRKQRGGTAKTWYSDDARPMLEVAFPSYPDAETASLARLLGTLEPQGPGKI